MSVLSALLNSDRGRRQVNSDVRHCHDCGKVILLPQEGVWRLRPDGRYWHGVPLDMVERPVCLSCDRRERQ